MRALPVFDRLFRQALAAFAAIVLAVPFADAQTTRPKPPPRLAPNPAESTRIPAGVDTGSPATSDALPLGTPVPPAGGADRGELRMRGAAARAAARPASAASGALYGPTPVITEQVRRDPSRPGTQAGTDDCAGAAARAYNAAMSSCTGLVDREARAACARRAADAQRASCRG